jgi:hypothetical protein
MFIMGNHRYFLVLTTGVPSPSSQALAANAKNRRTEVQHPCRERIPMTWPV